MPDTNMPSSLKERKLAAAKLFSQSIRRQVYFLHLAQRVRPLLYDAQQVNQVIADIDRIDHSCLDTAAADHIPQDGGLNTLFLKELKETLRKQATVEGFIEWLDSVVDQKIIKTTKPNGKSFKKRAQSFLLKWSFFGTRITHNLTLNNAKSFSSFHMIRMLLDEYILLAVETQMYSDLDGELELLLEQYLKQDSYFSLSASSKTGFTRYGITCGRLTNQSIKPEPLNQDGSYATENSGLQDVQQFSTNHLIPQVVNTANPLPTPPISPVTMAATCNRVSVISQNPASFSTTNYHNRYQTDVCGSHCWDDAYSSSVLHRPSDAQLPYPSTDRYSTYTDPHSTYCQQTSNFYPPDCYSATNNNYLTSCSRPVGDPLIQSRLIGDAVIQPRLPCCQDIADKGARLRDSVMYDEAMDTLPPPYYDQHAQTAAATGSLGYASSDNYGMRYSSGSFNMAALCTDDTLAPPAVQLGWNMRNLVS